MTLGAVAAVLVIVVTTVTVVVVGRPPAGSFGDTPAARAPGDLFAAANRLATVPAARYVGTAAAADGQPVTVDARVTNVGTTLAALTVGGQRAAALAVGGKLYVRADAAYWRREGAPADVVGAYAASWVRVEPDRFGVDFSGFAAPAEIADRLDLASWWGAVTVGPRGVIGGRPTRTFVVPGFAVSVATTGPPDVLRVERRVTGVAEPSPFPTAALLGPTPAVTPLGSTLARVVPARAPGDAEFTVDLSRVPEDELQSLYTEVKGRVQELKTSIDSLITFRLDGTVTLAPCTTNGCQANVTLRNSVSSSSPYVDVTRPVQAEITVAMTLDGRPVRTCVEARSMAPNGTVSVQCFAPYFIPPSRNPKVHQVRAQARAVARPVATADIQRIVDDVTAERARVRRPPAPTFPPDAARRQVPSEWGEGGPNKKENAGWRWFDPKRPDADRIRIDRAVPDSDYSSQRVDHVIVQRNGRVVGRDGKPLQGTGRIKDDPINAHIPLSQWLTWRTWYAP